jgi:hypothetical protein
LLIDPDGVLATTVAGQPEPVGSGCVSSHNARAVMIGSMPILFHLAGSSPQ